MSETIKTKSAAVVADIVMLALSLVVLGALLCQELLPLSPEVTRLLHWLDAGICGVFLVDFFVRFHLAENKWRFMKWGWIDFLSSLPFLPGLRWGRLVRVVRVLILLRTLRSAKVLIQLIFRSRVQGTLLSVGLIVGLVLLLSTVGILVCERSPESNIHTAGDALWWAFSTITSVGYGDYYPVTVEGRLLAALLMTAGVGLFSTLTAYLASFFVSDPEDTRRDEQLLAELRQLREEVERLAGKGK